MRARPVTGTLISISPTACASSGSTAIQRRSTYCDRRMVHLQCILKHGLDPYTWIHAHGSPAAKDRRAASRQHGRRCTATTARTRRSICSRRHPGRLRGQLGSGRDRGGVRGAGAPAGAGGGCRRRDGSDRGMPGHVRLNGCTWDQIARPLATNPEEAQLRYGPTSSVKGGILACMRLSRRFYRPLTAKVGLPSFTWSDGGELSSRPGGIPRMSHARDTSVRLFDSPRPPHRLSAGRQLA